MVIHVKLNLEKGSEIFKKRKDHMEWKMVET